MQKKKKGIATLCKKTEGIAKAVATIYMIWLAKPLALEHLAGLQHVKVIYSPKISSLVRLAGV